MTLKRKFLSRDFYKMELIELYLNISNVYKLSLGKGKKRTIILFSKDFSDFHTATFTAPSIQMVAIG